MKKRYTPDLVKQAATCEANYMRLCKLMPCLDDQDEWCYQVSWPEHSALLQVEIVERFTYTTTVKLNQYHPGGSAWLSVPELFVRLYHDASTAEVICSQTRGQLHGVYRYPNRKMQQPDEKIQLNTYLAEWLTHCLSHGHLTRPIFMG
ncbi:MAG: DUF1249 domain-containing protein [Pontibacterium sp.]